MNADQGKPTHFSSSLIAGVELALVGAFIRLSVFFIFQRFSVEFDLSPGFSIIDILFAALIGFIAGYRAYRRGAQSKRGRFLSGMISTIVLFEIYFALDMTGITRGIFPSNSEVITRISFTNLLWDLVYIVPIGIPIGLIAIPAPRVVEWFLEEKPVDHQPSASELAALHPGQHADDSGLPGPETFPEEVLPGYKLIQTGQPAQALRWLARYIKQRPKSEHAWLLLAYCLDDPQRRSESLKRVLKINPANKYAQSLMREIQNQTAQPLSTPTSETDGAAVTSVDVEAQREPKTKLHLVVTAVAMVLLTIWPFMLASISAFRFRLINQDVYVRNTTLLTTLPVGLILLREGVNQVRSFLKNGAITGAMVGFVDNLVISIAYHMVNLPARRTDTVTQAILRRIGEGTFGSILWGAVVGAVGAALPILISLGYKQLKKWIFNLAPRNAWASVLAAWISTDPDQKLAFVSGALAQQPGNSLAKRMQEQLLYDESQPTGAGTPKRKPPGEGGIHLPPLFSTTLGSKFVRRIAYAIAFVLIWILIEYLRGDPSEGISSLVYLLCCLGLLIGAAFILWFLVQGIQGRGNGSKNSHSGDPND